MRRFEEGRTKNDARLSSKQRWLPPTPGLRDWRTQMPRQEIERFEFVAGDLLEQLGYERCLSSVSPAIAESAAAAADMFVEGLRARRDPIPTGLWNA